MTNDLRPNEAKAIVLAILIAIEHGHQDVAAEAAALADDPKKLREILGNDSSRQKT